MTALTLISHPLCPFVQRAVIVLLEKGVEFDRINVDLSAKPDWFLALSPTGKVPVLKVRLLNADDAIIFESVKPGRMYGIQTYSVSGVEAVYHVVEHFAEHTGQIIFATKRLTAGDLGFYRHLGNPAHWERVP